MKKLQPAYVNTIKAQPSPMLNYTAAAAPVNSR
jgi:hypothetical protein